jgi:hypothetical protein
VVVVVPAIAMTAEVDGGVLADRGEPLDGGVVWPTLGCDAAGGKGAACVHEGWARGGEGARVRR